MEGKGRKSRPGSKIVLYDIESDMKGMMKVLTYSSASSLSKKTAS